MIVILPTTPEVLGQVVQGIVCVNSKSRKMKLVTENASDPIKTTPLGFVLPLMME